jgi:hypothetical protein
MKIIGIVGSPRIGGNTETITRVALDFLAQETRKSSKQQVLPESGHTLIRRGSTRYDLTTQLMDVDYTFEERDTAWVVLRTWQASMRDRFIFRYELEHLLGRTGYTVDHVYGGFDKTPYDYHSGKMLYVARKNER